MKKLAKKMKSPKLIRVAYRQELKKTQLKRTLSRAKIYLGLYMGKEKVFGI